LLSKYDINFYLSARPPEFWIAVVLVSTSSAVSLYFIFSTLINWIFALPLLLFSRNTPYDALQKSCQAVSGKRRNISAWLIGSLFAKVFLAAFFMAVLAAAGNIIIPGLIESFRLLIMALGLLLFIAWFFNLAVTFLFASFLSIIIMRLFDGVSLNNQPDRIPSDLTINERAGHQLHITKKMIFSGCILGTLIATAMIYYLMRELPKEDHIKIIAHRGSSAAAPENTLAAVIQAINDQADWVEIDVQETADGHVVVIHDSDLKKAGGIDIKIWKATLDQLQVIDIGSWFSPEFKNERIPTLKKVLETCKDKINVNIELKHYGYSQHLEKSVIDIIESTGMTQNVVIMSLDYGSIKKIRTLRPDWKIGILTSVTAGDISHLDVDFYAVNANLAKRSLISKARKDNREVFVWTVNDTVGMSKMISRGVDGIITDKPELVREILDQRAELSVPERLLIELATLFGYESRYLKQ